ncbi:MAG TPA: hypothetical protein VNC78_07900 [Actinomycetota bacterium]|nr:hypothetical protein [Actinomycetota bacterium]
MSLAPESSRPRLLLRIALLVVVGIVAVLAAKYYIQRPLTFEGNGVSLEYPRTWEKVTGSFTPPAGINLVWAQGFALDDDNGAGVAAASLGAAVPEQFLSAAVREQLQPTLEQAVSSAGGTIAGPQSIEVDGRDALIYNASNLTLTAAIVDVSITVIAEGSFVYFIACQSTPERSTEVDEGCETIRTSFSID